MRGILSASIVEKMEEKAGKPAHELFDCFVGTSAGSVLAAGLAAGKSVQEIKQTFLNIGKQLSTLMTPGSAGELSETEKTKRRARNEAERRAIAEDSALTPDEKDAEELKRLQKAVKENEQERANASSKLLSETLEELFGDQKSCDVDKKFAVVTRNTAKGQVVFFGNFPPDGLESPSFWKSNVDENSSSIHDIIMRSAALPPYFSKDGAYLDGGISPFANPTYAAYVGVQRRLEQNPYREPLQFYSVGTGFRAGKENDSLVAMMMQDINFLQHQIMKRLRDNGHVWYKRYNIGFSVEGFNKLGIEPPAEDVMNKLVLTSSGEIEVLDKLGTLVGEKLVEKSDFDPWQGPEDRRNHTQSTTNERRQYRA